jgi:hypothetical protein
MLVHDCIAIIIYICSFFPSYLVYNMIFTLFIPFLFKKLLWYSNFFVILLHSFANLFKFLFIFGKTTLNWSVFLSSEDYCIICQNCASCDLFSSTKYHDVKNTQKVVPFLKLKFFVWKTYNKFANLSDDEKG